MNSISYIAHRVDDAISPVDHTGEPHEDEHLPAEEHPQQHQHQHQQRQKPKVEFTTLHHMINIVLFVPNFLLVRPLLSMWFIMTFPLSLLERKKTKEDNNDEHTHKEKPSSTTSKSAAIRRFSNTTILELDEDSERLEPETSDDIDLKSPTSPLSSKITLSRHLAFPKTVFPQMLVNSDLRKTLILDLDETLVHSLSRGARMSNGHMIEIKLADQVATLYSVHKRPYCDHFLKQVSAWFNLVIFTASVKEYADPVIDWLESERKYFAKRYYRNHCTLREGQGYIKDLSSVDKNLSHMIIIDNSPISYAWHESNAITVEGWINDASDTDLLNLIPLLKSLRYTTDVRTILALKNGEAAFEK